MPGTIYLFISILVNNVIEVCVVVDHVIVVNDSFDTSVLFWPIYLELLAEPGTHSMMSHMK